MQNVQLGLIDYAILAIYVVFVIGIGFALKRYMKSSSDFLTSGPLDSGLGHGAGVHLGEPGRAGTGGHGRQRRQVRHRHLPFLLGRRHSGDGLPGGVHDALLLRLKARSVPEYLKLRFDERTRCLNSISFAVMTVFASGISMNALAKLLNQLLGWNYDISLWICSAVVLVYVLKGGLTSAIYTEVLQFFMIVLGFAPVVYLGLKDVGGWDALTGKLSQGGSAPGGPGADC